MAEVTGLRKHDFKGTATALEIPNLPEQYGETASDAEGPSVQQMRAWLSMATPFLQSARRRSA